MAYEIEAAELKKALDAGEGVVVVDVREAWEHALGSLPNAVHIPVRDLVVRLAELDPEKPYVLYCHHGMRSLNAVVALAERGFRRVRSLRGGIDRWSAEIDPSVPRY
jgi:rhodanese-related sulfurtransferase